MAYQKANVEGYFITTHTKYDTTVPINSDRSMTSKIKWKFLSQITTFYCHDTLKWVILIQLVRIEKTYSIGRMVSTYKQMEGM